MKRTIVLDTNCLIQSLPMHSHYHKVWTDFMNGQYLLCVSNEILDEYEEIIERLVTPTVAKYIIDAIIHSPYTLYKEAHYKFRLIENDPDDNKFVDCAIASGAEYIVSEDAHFRCLANIAFPSVKVINLDNFMQELDSNKS